MTEQRPTRVVILGGGFGGLYTALELDKLMRHEPNLEVTLVNRENFFVFTPMLHEVAASDIDVTHIANPIRRMLKRVRFFQGQVEHIDLDQKQVYVTHGDGHGHTLEYDHVVLALGSITNFYNLPGMAERALTMKSLGDAIMLRNKLIQLLEESDPECAVAHRCQFLTFVVAGGGFAGVETIAGINDFLRESIDCYPHLSEAALRVVLVHPGPYLLPELGEELGRYTEQKLAERGVEIRLNTKVTGINDDGVTLSDGEVIPTKTLVWTAGTAANPALNTAVCAKDRGRIVVDACLQVPDRPGVWAVGDCAAVPDPATGKTHPPTAQHALREGKVLARNIVASMRGEPLKPFAFQSLGQLAAIGRRAGVANVMGHNFSGFTAWWLWRTIYLSKLPRFEKKVRVAVDWTMDLLFPKDLVQFDTALATSISHAEPEPAAAATTTGKPRELALAGD